MAAMTAERQLPSLQCSLRPSLREATAGELLLADEANVVAHMSWVQERTAGMSVTADEGLVVVDSGLPSDTFNVVCRARLEEASLGERIEAVTSRFRRVQRPFTWWVGPADRPASLGQALLDAGFRAQGTEPGMAADLEALPPAALAPRGLRIARARTAAQLRDFAAVLASLATPPDPAVLRFYEAAAPAILAPDSPIGAYVGYLGDVAVASAEVTLAGGVAGLYSVAVLAPYRRQGIGTAMTLAPLLDARADGWRTAVLQASSEGERVYRRLGFRAMGTFTEYHVRAE